MRASLSVLDRAERERVHEHTLHVLATTGMRVDTARGRAILREAGAEVDDERRRVRFPAELVERSLAQPPRQFELAGRRAGWRHSMGTGATTLTADGGGTLVVDAETGKRRPATGDDWRRATRLCDALDDIGVYWWTVSPPYGLGSPAGLVAYARELFGEFGKHVQDSFAAPAAAAWWLRALEIVFGGREEVRRRHPFSFLITPASPLVIEEHYTDTWLGLRGWDIPVAVMPMPLMGATAPATRLATLLLANCETLGTLCLVQAAEPGVPFIYAPVVAIMDPRRGTYAAGDIENAVLSVGAIEMARFYGLPVLASGCGTDASIPSPQAAYEKAASALLAGLPGPDLLVGPGMLAGATILSLEQLVLDVEMARMALTASEGILVDDDRWLDEALQRVGPGGNFLGEPSTRRSLRDGEWSARRGLRAGRGGSSPPASTPTLDAAREEVRRLLAERRPDPLPDDVDKALRELEREARLAT
jgi:trimethylamine--corrinoid protein Co-methyltransferase